MRGSTLIATKYVTAFRLRKNLQSGFPLSFKMRGSHHMPHSLKIYRRYLSLFMRTLILLQIIAFVNNFKTCLLRIYLPTLKGICIIFSN